MFQLINSDKLEGVIRNPIAFYFPIQRGFSGPIQTLGYDKAHCEPSAEVKTNQWVCAFTLRLNTRPIKSGIESKPGDLANQLDSRQGRVDTHRRG